MTWLTWRQFRVPAVSVFVALAGIAVTLAITGPDLVGRTEFSNDEFLYVATLVALYVLPAVVGVFWGVPMVTRELEAGTHNLVWNQTVTRGRWLTSKLTIGVLASMVAAGVLTLAVTWWASPIDAMASADPERALLNRLSPVAFSARGIVPVGYAAFAFVLGIAVGILLRRTVAAMAVTLVVFVAVLVAVPLVVRPYLLPITEETVTVTPENIWQIRGGPDGLEEITVLRPAGSWTLANETVDQNGAVVSPLPDTVRDCVPPPNRSAAAPPDRDSAMTCLTDALAADGLQQRLSYHPAHHFWPLQWIETGLFLALSALLAWFSFRRIRHLS